MAAVGVRPAVDDFPLVGVLGVVNRLDVDRVIQEARDGAVLDPRSVVEHETAAGHEGVSRMFHRIGREGVVFVNGRDGAVRQAVIARRLNRDVPDDRPRPAAAVGAAERVVDDDAVNVVIKD